MSIDRDKPFRRRDRDDFIRHFATQFMAAWCAKNYDDACLRGRHEPLGTPPCEDAIHLAQCAWDAMQNVGCMEELRINPVTVERDGDTVFIQQAPDICEDEADIVAIHYPEGVRLLISQLTETLDAMEVDEQ